MTSHSEHGDIYEQLMSISQEALVISLYETAYHALCAAMHHAQALGDKQRLLAVEQVAKAQQNLIDTSEPAHRLSTQSVRQRNATSIYMMLAKQAATQALILQQQHRREQIQSAPWPDDTRQGEREAEIQRWGDGGEF